MAMNMTPWNLPGPKFVTREVRYDDILKVYRRFEWYKFPLFGRPSAHELSKEIPAAEPSPSEGLLRKNKIAHVDPQTVDNWIKECCEVGRSGLRGYQNDHLDSLLSKAKKILAAVYKVAGTPIVPEIFAELQKPKMQKRGRTKNRAVTQLVNWGNKPLKNMFEIWSRISNSLNGEVPDYSAEQREILNAAFLSVIARISWNLPKLTRKISSCILENGIDLNVDDLLEKSVLKLSLDPLAPPLLAKKVPIKYRLRNLKCIVKKYS